MANRDSTEQQDPCPLATVIEVFGGKWKTTILYHLVHEGTLRFGELRRLIPGVSQRVLTQQLRELERDGLLRRRQYPEIPPRVEYSSTSLAVSLIPLFETIENWGQVNLAAVTASRRSFEAEGAGAASRSSPSEGE